MNVMRSLFLKIFLWFWATDVLIAVAAALIIGLSIQNQPEIMNSRWRQNMGDAMSLYADSAAEAYEHNGQAGLNDFLTRLDRMHMPVHASLRDEQGKIIGGQSRIAAADDLVALAQKSDQPEFNVQDREAVGVKAITTSSGHKYLFVAEISRRPPPPIIPFPRGLFGWERWIVSIVISGLICYALTRYLTRPVMRLREAARRISSGDLSTRLEPSLARRHDEFGELVRDFNTMADRIESLVAAQRQLLSDISHELRSPLARMNLALELARQRSGPESAAVLDRMEREADRLNDLIGNLLTIARLDSKESAPEATVVDLGELVHEVAADANFEARSRNCDVRVVASDPCSVRGNADLLHSAVENVVRNAVRYTNQGTTVEIRLTCSNGNGNGSARRAVISVRDHGPGVPESELINVFRPFYRVEVARERKSGTPAGGGVGLGLAITKRALDLYDGTVVARNADGGGLQVEITLPVVNAPVPAHV
jgi:two-component system, OmpR family, sensor histidine kinase CpxA